MPLNAKGRKILAAMVEQYGDEKKAKQVFYASVNAGRITGVEGKDAFLAVADADGHLWSHGVPLSDVGLMDEVEFTTDGYLKGWAKVARTGTQKYRGFEVGLPQKDSVVLYRPPEEVFSRDAMHSMANKPITLTHPKKMVDAKSWAKVAKGFSGNEVVRDGDMVRVPLLLTDAEAIDAYKSGAAREMSVGYLTDIDWSRGETPSGEAYDGVQRSIRCNHHAMVPVARGGRGLRFGDAWMDEPVDQTGSVCPNCGAGLTGSPISCPNCGFDLRPVQTSMSRDEVRFLRGAKDMANGDDDDGDENGNGRRKKPFKGAAEPFKAGDAYWLDDREFSSERREELAKSGKAKPDGSYPIVTVGDLKNAIRAWGRGGATASDKAHIIKRARALGAENELPEDWKNGGSSSAKDAAIFREGVMNMAIIETMDGFPISFADENSATVAKQLFARLNKQIRDQQAAKKKDDEDAVEEEQEREKKERGYKDSIAARDGEIAVLRKQLNEATLTDAQKDVLLAQRQMLVDQARPFLPDGFKLDGVSASAIRRAVVAHALGDSVTKDWGDPQVEGAFLTIARGGQPRSSGVNRMATGMSDAMRTTEGWLNTQSGGIGMNDAAKAEESYQQYVKDLQDAYKHPISYKPN